MQRLLRRMVMVALLSLASAAAAEADGGAANGPWGSPRGTDFDITHVDVIPATINGLDFQETAYGTMFEYRERQPARPGIGELPHRELDPRCQPSAQIIDVSGQSRNAQPASSSIHSVKFRFAVQNVPSPPPAPFDCCIGSPIDDRQYSLVKSFGTPWTSNRLPSTVGPTGALFVTYVDFLARSSE